MLIKSNKVNRQLAGSFSTGCIPGMVILVLAIGVLSETAGAQITDNNVSGVGEVTVNDLYVRSGDSANHYTVTKLKAGDRVSIVGQRGSWYEILPPVGTFSLISGDYVDTEDDRNGVVNGNNVRVRAGSLLNDNKYTVQTQLSKGTQVAIMGRNPDGFLRIIPPAGATFWVNSDYVQMVSQSRLALDQDSTTATPSAAGDSIPDTTTQPVINNSTDTNAPTNGLSTDKTVTTPVTSEKTLSSTTERKDTIVSTGTDGIHISAFKGLPPTDQRRTLDQIDLASQAEMAKPMFQRNWKPVIQRYQVIANQTEDEMATQYATKRIEQINKMIELVDTVKKMRKLNEVAESKRRESLEDRSSIQTVLPPAPSGIDAEGELRTSALYPPGTIPQRFRLVHVSTEGERTIGYVEIPVGSSLSVDGFLGKLVGIRSSSRRLQEGGVEAIPIFVARELVLLEQDRQAEAVSNDH